MPQRGSDTASQREVVDWLILKLTEFTKQPLRLQQLAREIKTMVVLEMGSEKRAGDGIRKADQKRCATDKRAMDDGGDAATELFSSCQNGMLAGYHVMLCLNIRKTYSFGNE